MDLLILGGTVFLGRHLTEVALAGGHRVTHFNRGRTDVGLFPHVETLVGDRDTGSLDALGDRQWDAVIDTCGYIPRVVRESAAALSGRAKHYTFVSSISVYEDFAAANHESSKLASLDDETTETVNGETYGGLKALCERAADDAFTGDVLHARSGLIVGPHDPTDRFTYWPVRMKRGGDVIAPGRRDARVEFIDARDLSLWILHAIDHELTGPINVTGPTEPITMEAFLETCRETCNPEANLIWVDDEALTSRDVAPWVGLPMWIPGVDMQANTELAKENRLWTRPLADIVRDTLAWAITRPDEGTFKNTLTAEREAEILAAVRAG